jgi:creatinine amidohydrolase/Fe(II)-dependent formamide hydrolase-like protein
MFIRGAIAPCILVLLLIPNSVTAQNPEPPGLSERGLSPDPEMSRPIEAFDSVFIEELTWVEVRDAVRSGKTTAIIATGGVEQNGPYLATGKHNYVLRAVTEAIARKLGDALVAPIVPFVPEGDIDPPTAHMRYPGTISVRADTFKRLLTDIANSLRIHGFRQVVLIGDSGRNQDGMREVAEELSGAWEGSGATIHYIAEYYDNPRVARWLQAQGIHEVDEGLHDNLQYTTQMMVVDPATVRMRQRVAVGKFSINGVSLAPPEKTIALGKRLVEYQASVTVEAIRKTRRRQP